MPGYLKNTYILIVGKGRSGSNRMLDILDTGRRTVCRNEVNEINGTDFSGIGGEFFPQDFGSQQLAVLRKALSRATLRRSARDRLSQIDKDYLTALGRAVIPLFAKARLRRGLGKIGLLEGESEWRLPTMFLQPEKVLEARLVVKLNSTPSWAAALAHTDDRCRILHNVREPLEYLQSWFNRFIKDRAGISSFEQNFRDVPKILAHFNRQDSNRLREPTDRNLIEVELWRWRYVNESLRSLNTHSDRYLCMTYSEIEADLLGSARRIFEFAELKLGDREEARIRSLRNTLFQKPHTTSLDEALCNRLIAEVLEDSSLRNVISLRTR